jgi:GTP-binding protein
MSLLVALVGRPNVGKSTLFNRLAGKKLAIVHDEPGITRDRRYGRGSIGDITFDLVDTPGLETAYIPKDKDLILHGLWHHTQQALQECHVILFIVDGREGITLQDKDLGRLLRKLNKPCIFLVNKAEGNAAQSTVFEAASLGLGAPIPISAEHGEGFNMLYEALQPFYDACPQQEIDESAPPTLSIAVIGRPNVGKSTLINQIVGKERFLTGPIAGLTRESLAVDFIWQDHPLKLIDTAGLRRQARITESVERLSAADTNRAMQYAQAVLLVVDATMPLEKQDLTMARQVVEEGRILLFVFNKIDLIENKDAFLKEMRLKLGEELAQLPHPSVVAVSALNKKDLGKIFEKLFELYPLWEKRIATSPLNDWLIATTTHHPPPLASGRRIKIRYMTQIKSRPPTFVLFINKPLDLPESYLRYLKNRMAEDFRLGGIPLRLIPRKGKNPYDEGRES